MGLVELNQCHGVIGRHRERDTRKDIVDMSQPGEWIEIFAKNNPKVTLGNVQAIESSALMLHDGVLVDLGSDPSMPPKLLKLCVSKNTRVLQISSDTALSVTVFPIKGIITREGRVVGIRNDAIVRVAYRPDKCVYLDVYHPKGYAEFGPNDWAVRRMEEPVVEDPLRIPEWGEYIRLWLWHRSHLIGGLTEEEQQWARHRLEGYKTRDIKQRLTRSS